MTDLFDIKTAVNLAGDEVGRALKNAAPGLADLTSHLNKTRGKGARTALLINCAANDAGEAPITAVKAAAAIELLHMATLAHDDVIDAADTRRGVPSLNAAFGERGAVICGDYLLCLALTKLNEAFEALGDYDGNAEQRERARLLSKKFISALTGICKGEFMQKQARADADLDALSYTRIINGKTAALFYVSAFAGAVAAEEGKRAANGLARFGRLTGLIFQILDDCKDYALDDAQALKPTARDAACGVITLPFILAARNDKTLKEAAREAAKAGFATKDFIDGVINNGGVSGSVETAKRYRGKAIDALSAVSPAKRERLSAYLTDLTDKTIHDLV